MGHVLILSNDFTVNMKQEPAGDSLKLNIWTESRGKQPVSTYQQLYEAHEQANYKIVSPARNHKLLSFTFWCFATNLDTAYLLISTFKSKVDGWCFELRLC